MRRIEKVCSARREVGRREGGGWARRKDGEMRGCVSESVQYH
jgi:hypothetical protein